jgi:transglutaminase-like putative cysteine protease
MLASVWLCLLPLLRQFPATLAITLGATALLTGLLAWKHNLPVPLRLLLVLLMLFAVTWQTGSRFGRDTGCALLAAMLAIKASELHSLRDARSLLGFSLFAPFAAFLLDQGPITMALALLAVVTSLLSMQRLADQECHARRPTGTQLQAIARFCLIGLPLALAAFWLFPRLGSPLWGIPERAMSRPGLADSMAMDEWLELMNDDSPALRVKFFGTPPAAEQRYWRGAVLWEFNGQRWSAAPWLPASTTAEPAASVTQWDYQIDYEPTDHRLLVALDWPRQAPPGAHLSSADQVLRSDQPLTSITRWRMQSSASPARAPPLSALARRLALQLPAGYNPRTLALAQQWRQQEGNDDQAIVQRALDWIKREFHYTLATAPPGRDNVDEFLFTTKAGYCQHYSSSFVVLMRAAGIPARVVTGYTGGLYNRLGDYWVIRRMDAHAWAEVWLPQRGWVRIDPTAAVAPERILDTLEDRLRQSRGNAAGDLSGVWNLGELGDWMRHNWNEMMLSFDAGRQQRLLSAIGIAQLQRWQLIALFALVAGTLLAWMTWLLSRGEREPDPLLRAWHRMQHGYRRHGLACQLHEPALQWAERVHRTRADPQLISLSQRFADARYADMRTHRSHAKLITDLLKHHPSTGAH